MDRDLWNWSYDQDFCILDADENNRRMDSGCQAGFYFGSGKDVIEENIMNVKSCIQVLKIWIKKADDDIVELERDLVLLQCDLAWREDAKQFEVYCNALREQIHILDSSIKSLRQSDTMYTDDQLLLPRQPAEKLCEVLKPLLGEGCQQNDPQIATAMDNQHIHTSSIIIKSEEMKDDGSFPESDTIMNGSLLKREKTGGIPGAEEEPGISISKVCSHALRKENSYLQLEKLGSSVTKLKIEEAEEHCMDATDMGRKLKSSSVLDGECDLPEAQKLGKSVLEVVNPNVSRQSDGFSGNKRSFDSSSSFLAQSNNGNVKVDERLIDFIMRSKKNKRNEEPTVSDSNRSASSCLSSNPKGKVDNDHEVLNTEKPGPFDSCNIPMFLLSKLQDWQGKDTNATSSQTKKSNSLLLEDSHKPKAFVEKVQRKSHTTFSKAKKNRKPKTIGDNSSFGKIFEPKPLLESVERSQIKAKVQDDAVDAYKNLCPLLQNKGNSKMPVGRELKKLSVADDFSISYRIKPESETEKDVLMVKSCPRPNSDNYSTGTTAHLPRKGTPKLKSLKFEDLTLVDLRFLAKELKLTKYHKLRKGVLIECIVNKMEAAKTRS